MEFNDGMYSFYREVDELSLLNKLFATLISEKLNINNYLANSTIKSKLNLKEILDNLDYILSNSLDDIKNLIKINKGYPIYKLDDIELISVIKTKVAGEYKEEIVIENINEEVKVILNLIKDIINKMQTHQSFETINVLANISFELKKSILDL